MINWREYFTDGQMLGQLANLVGEPRKSRYETDEEITEHLNNLISKYPEAFQNIIDDLENCIAEYECNYEILTM